MPFQALQSGSELKLYLCVCVLETKAVFHMKFLLYTKLKPQWVCFGVPLVALSSAKLQQGQESCRSVLFGVQDVPVVWSALAVQGLNRRMGGVDTVVVELISWNSFV